MNNLYFYILFCIHSDDYCIHFAGFVDTMLELHRKYGTPQRIWLGQDLWVAVSKPKDVEVRA